MHLVIASEAKQSESLECKDLDCFALDILRQARGSAQGSQ